MPADHSMEVHAARHTWLVDPLDIMAIIEGIKEECEYVTLRKDELFRIVEAGYSAFDGKELVFRIEPADSNKFVPMGFFTLKYLQLQLDKM